MSTVMEASELDAQGLSEVKILTNAIRHHQIQMQDLGKRRKQLILRLRKQRITYREIAEAMGVSEQLIYKIIKDDIPREPEYDAEGNLIRRRGRPPKSLTEIIATAQKKLDIEAEKFAIEASDSKNPVI
jgi:IS30 family transposase